MTEYLLLLAKIVGVMLITFPIILAAITVEIDYYFKTKQEAMEKSTEYKFKVIGQCGEALSKMLDKKLERMKNNEVSK